MKNILCFISALLLCSCGTMGIGGNNTVNIHNDSKAAINATGANGNTKIQPHAKKSVESSSTITLKSINKNCKKTDIPQHLNTLAFALDIIPGIALLGIPLVVDIINDKLYTMPSTYKYQCK